MVHYKDTRMSCWRKRFPTLPKFLSTHMTCTCGNTLWVYPALMCTVMLQHTKHQSIPRHTQPHSGQLSGPEDIYGYILYSIIMLFS